MDRLSCCQLKSSQRKWMRRLRWVVEMNGGLLFIINLLAVLGRYEFEMVFFVADLSF